MKTPALLAFLTIALAARAVDYRISATVDDNDGKTYYMTDYFRNEAVIDSATVVDGRIILSGNYDRTAYVRIHRGHNFCNCILEDTPVELDFNTHSPLSGGELNARFGNYLKQLEARDRDIDSCIEVYRAKYPDIKQFRTEFKKLYDSRFGPEKARDLELLGENAGNGFGEYLLMKNHYNVKPADWTAFYASLPQSLTDLPLSRNFNELKEAELKTDIGRMFVDLDAKNPDGTPARLSDYVGKGKYILVDFWASWCVPCRNEGRETLKPLYERYRDDGRIEFLGVATWDKDSKTLKALEEEGYPWPQLIGAGKAPMEKYGFIGIPMIMLFAPDGTIIARDLHGATLVSTVDDIMSREQKP